MKMENVHMVISRMRKFTYPFVLFLFLWILVASCTQTGKGKKEVTLSFDKNIIGTNKPELVCQLVEDSVLLGEIKDFSFLNDTSFVVVDGHGAYLYHTSGTLIKQFGYSGRAGGEMLSPSSVFVTSKFVYIWCSTLMKILIFDHETYFKDELSGFERAVHKFVVAPNDEMLFLYTSGFYDDSENKTVNVINIYSIAERTTKKLHGERTGKDEVLSVWQNSGGLYAGVNRIVYLHPGNLTIHDLEVNSMKHVLHKIKDKAFNTEEVINSRDIINNKQKLFDYIYKNSVVRGLYNNDGQFIVIAEIGQFDQLKMEQKNRKLKLYVLDSSFTPIHTIRYDYVYSPNFLVHSGAMYFLTINSTDRDQTITLNRFSLQENSGTK